MEIDESVWPLAMDGAEVAVTAPGAEIRLLGWSMLILACLGGTVLAQSTKAVPVEATRIIAKVNLAAKRRDLETLRSLMVRDLIWSFGGDADANQAIASWKEDQGALRRLYRVTGMKCELKKDGIVQCPTKAGTGYRAGFKNTPAGWKMIYFVGGD